MGLSYREIGLLYPGEMRDLIEEYKKHHNMMIQKKLYKIDEDEPVSSGDAL